MKSKLLTLFAFLTLIQINAQIRIVEVDPSTNTVKLHNYGSANNPQDISTYWFCARIVYEGVSATTLISGSTNLAIGADVVLRMNSLDFNDTSSDIGFYNSPSFGSSTAMEDFMQYGAGGLGRESVAVAKGIWTAGEFIQVVPPYEYIGNGMQTGGSAENGVAFWETLLSNEEFEINNQFLIYPNPSSTNIEIKIPRSAATNSVLVYDILGKTLIDEKLNDNYLNLDVSNWLEGIYLVRVTSGENVQTKRFIKL